MKYLDKFKIFALILMMILPFIGYSQFQVEGSFRFRFYNDQFTNSIDNRDAEVYIRQLTRIKGSINLNTKTKFVTEVLSFTDNGATSPVRNIAGTGYTFYGIGKAYAEYVQPNIGFINLLRVRVGRQQFPLGKGLSHNESYYYIQNFDGARLDFKVQSFQLSLFGSITGQNVSQSGLYPDPGSDQLYIVKATQNVFHHELLGYYIYNKIRGDFNDSYIFGGGISAKLFKNNLTYFAEGAYQKFNTIGGLPSKGGLGFMAGISYMFRDVLAFKYIKIETRYAAYQGDDEKTSEYEQFSPLYPSFSWGDRRGWVNGVNGGDFPHAGRNLEGTRIWYTRIYFVPSFHSALRLQFQYLKLAEYINNDNYDGTASEYALKLFYRLSRQSMIELRYVVNKSNDVDEDLNENGIISWSEDRVDYTRIMLGLQFKF